MTPSPAALALTDKIISRWNATQPESVRVAIAEVVEEVLKRERMLREALTVMIDVLDPKGRSVDREVIQSALNVSRFVMLSTEPQNETPV